VDHRVQADQPGLNPDSSKAAGDGSSYLRQLKSSEAGTSVATTPSGTTSGQGSPTGKERRRSVRYRCSGSVDFRSEGSDVRMWGTLTDVSLHGCYVEMNTTFPVGTKVDLNLEAMGIRVRVQGTVRVSYPFLGMGIMFTDIEPGQQIQLGQVLAALSGQSSLPTPDSAPAPAPNSESVLSAAVSGADPRRVVDEVRQFFTSNRLLSREEFLLIAKRASRS
jgi:PilZ domain-containing protein